MIKSIIFDFDGTLVDSKDVMISAYNQVAREHHYIPMNSEAFDHFQTLSVKERCTELGIPLHKTPFLVSDLSKRYKQSLHAIQLIDGIPMVLNHLKSAGYDLAIISSNREKNIRDYLLSHDLACFSSVICSRELFGKDRLIHRFLKKRHLKPAEAIYVGDEERDIVASKKSGIRVIWAGWGFDSYEKVKRAEPDFVAERPDDIVQIMDQVAKVHVQ